MGRQGGLTRGRLSWLLRRGAHVRPTAGYGETPARRSTPECRVDVHDGSRVVRRSGFGLVVHCRRLWPAHAAGMARTRASELAPPPAHESSPRTPGDGTGGGRGKVGGAGGVRRLSHRRHRRPGVRRRLPAAGTGRALSALACGRARPPDSCAPPDCVSPLHGARTVAPYARFAGGGTGKRRTSAAPAGTVRVP
jgi:hypothetical protein